MNVKEYIEKYMTERKDFQRYFLERLVDDDGYVKRPQKKYDAFRAMDVEMLIKFLNDTQQTKMAALAKKFGKERDEAIANKVNAALTSKSRGLLSVLKGKVEIGGQSLEIVAKPQASKLNRKANENCAKNIFSVMEEVVAGPKQRIDLVIFLNGLAIISIELKCNPAGQNVDRAIRQYRNERDPKNRLFLFKAGCLVHFAMDLYDVFMTTRLNGTDTVFLPFNRGNGDGKSCGAGNPRSDDEFSTGYMWADILTKETLLDLIFRYCYVKKTEKKKYKNKTIPEKEDIIFPRYHQLDCVREATGDVLKNGTENNYLIEHSAGSGKTNTIVWLAYRMATLHDADDKRVVDKVIVMTDRVVVDRQLQRALYQIDHEDGEIELIDDEKKSKDLASAITGKTKIIGTTIQKFRYILKQLQRNKDKKFAVLIDEAHSSTSGREMEAVTKVLGLKEGEKPKTPDELLDEEIKCLGKQPNVTMFAFTATPKTKTLRMFGTEGVDGKFRPFHLYSMKQAIEEGFILDVLDNYIEYESFYTIVKKTAEDKKYPQRAAAAKIARFAMLHPTMIAQRVEIIVEHFREAVMKNSDYPAKAMIVTGSREEAVKYSLAINKYIVEQGYDDLRTLVAFSETKKVDGKEYSEVGLNKAVDPNYREAMLPDIFEYEDDVRILIVADKYQTGFDQPKLTAMYVLKKLKDVAAVQTLSRLNRINPPHDKHTFVLDFVNTVAGMEKAFAPYYEKTILSNDVTVEKVYDRIAEIEAYGFLSINDIDKAWELACCEKTSATQKKISALFKSARDSYFALSEDEQSDALRKMRQFVRAYDFIVQAMFLEDGALHKKRCFVGILIPMVTPGDPKSVIDLRNKIDAIGIGQRKVRETNKSNLKAKGELKFTEGDGAPEEEDLKEKLSKIIEMLNARTGRAHNEPAAQKLMLQFADQAKESAKVRKIAKANPDREDFRMPFREEMRKIISKTYSENTDLVTALLEDEDIRNDLCEAMIDNVLESLK